MTEMAPKRMTIEEFLAWKGEPNVGYQLRDGYPVAMASPSDAHGILAANIVMAIGSSPKRRPECRPRVQTAIASVSNPRSMHEADIVVACTPSEPGHSAGGQPVVIIEVVSPSTVDYDFQVKLPDYRLMPSVREIVLLDSDRKLCHLHRRPEQGGWWLAPIFSGDDGVLRLDSIGFEATLASLYEGVPIAVTPGA
jgi:Uma2 family endonuclease